MAREFFCLRRSIRLFFWTTTVVLLVVRAVYPQEGSDDWQQRVSESGQHHQWDAAFAVIDQRLEKDPADLEARGWRGRVLAWQGHWASAETEYRRVLEQAPNDTEILCGLADVLLWQGRLKDSLRIVDHAREIDPKNSEILLRRARILSALEDSAEARSQYREILALDPQNQEAKSELAGLGIENRHELRLGFDASTFNYIGPAEDETLFLTSHWTSRITTTFNTGVYQRFGQNAGDFVGSGSYRITKGDWLTVGGAIANHQSVIPEYESFFEFGHGFRFSNRRVKGLEASYQQHWFWYQGAHVLTLSGTQLYYLPKEWTWTISVTGARSGFTGTGIEWVPSGYTRLGFPLYRNLSGNVTFANGTENFAQIDQIGRFSARTYAGGLKYRFTQAQDVTGYIAVQDRSDGDTENSFGVSYGFRF
jgi:cytochrome c-type biogenesis protein CcmH/NrfG